MPRPAPGPILVHVTEDVGHREPPRETGDPLMDALAVHLQRLACQGALDALVCTCIGRDWMEVALDVDWRAQVAPDARRLIGVLEDQGVMRFGEHRA